MFQSFTETARPDQGPPRLEALRRAMADAGLAGWLVPRADAHQGEYVAACDDRLAWLTGFTGSAGFCAALADAAGVFTDGRYRVQVRAQVDTGHFTAVDWPETRLGPWLRQHLPEGGTVGFDPWLYTPEQIEALTEALTGSAIHLTSHTNLIDAVWPDRPAPPQGAITPWPDSLAGASHAEKRAALAETLRKAGQRSAVITLTDSIAWLFNIRGCDIPRNPVAQGFAIIHDTGHATFFTDPAKLDATARTHLGDAVTLAPPDAFETALAALPGPVRLDRANVPLRVVQVLDAAGVAHQWGADPCILPKARKTQAEITATRIAHLRDGAAMCEFLAWFDAQPPGTLTEIDVARRLEACRAATGQLLDISFDTIAGSGPNGALPHYRVSEASNRTLVDGDLLVLDSGGQYLDGTTDITRTLPVGIPGADERAAFTRVLQGMIAISRLRFPRGLAGRDLDAIARYPLWLADQDYAHGTGHGVGVYLCVHEGPQRLSRLSEVPLEPGMILSNEPGYYREGAFGIRIENLIVVTALDPLPGGDGVTQFGFETLTYTPLDTRLIDADLLTKPERDWLNTYHTACRDKIGPLLSAPARLWLDKVTQTS
ncbi:aminopeptidase P family protein [Roseovarius sp. 217]|uniref:aminopeptidase P family protein n=1 Tax=Roseovarius sp. (strain 217) TaxID=314264 RepID=UPI0000685A4F|nr:aminopeptidase P family protein [Roseovarius sp. 217]EAQ27537.1 aminopeptidase P [Roseovarius sp. 217]